MAESLAHIKYVERMARYAETIPQEFVPTAMSADLPSYGQRTPKIINGYYPDLYYYDLHCVIIGEAKTTNDIENEHTRSQLDSYICEIRTYNCDKHIIICSRIRTDNQHGNTQEAERIYSRHYVSCIRQSFTA